MESIALTIGSHQHKHNKSEQHAHDKRNTTVIRSTNSDKFTNNAQDNTIANQINEMINKRKQQNLEADKLEKLALKTTINPKLHLKQKHKPKENKKRTKPPEGKQFTKENENKNRPSVDTDCGKVIGRSTKIENKTVHEFMNIPYAVSPVGPMRWRPSQLLSSVKEKCWQDALPAYERTAIRCTQFWGRLSDTEDTTEDCLVLSVRTPHHIHDRKSASSLLPVLVWIHGGSLEAGYGDDSGYGVTAELTSDMNAVTVNINYRLGPLGWMTLEELWDETKGSESYGNYGLTDQITALKWVRNNIHHFGGDPNSVTLLGNSAGATSILALMAAPAADELFHRAWAQSPMTKFQTDYKEQAVVNRQIYLKQLGCSDIKTECPENRENLVEYFSVSRNQSANIAQMRPNVNLTPTCKQRQRNAVRECLYGLSAEDIHQKYRRVMGSHLARFPKPNEPLAERLGYLVTDPIVLPRSPLASKRNSNVTLLVSNMAQESIKDLTPRSWHTNWTEFKQLVRNRIEQHNMSKFDDLFSVYPDQNKAKSSLWLWNTLVTDIRATCSTNRFARAFSEKASVYRLYIENGPSHPFTMRWKITGRQGHGKSLKEIIYEQLRQQQKAVKQKDNRVNGSTEESVSMNRTIKQMIRKSIASNPQKSIDLAFHMWDAIAMFGFKDTLFFSTKWKPKAKDKMFQRQLKKILKSFVHTGKPGPLPWSKYPSKTAILRNRQTQMLDFGSEGIQRQQCDMWTDNGFDKFGWQM